MRLPFERVTAEDAKPKSVPVTVSVEPTVGHVVPAGHPALSTVGSAQTAVGGSADRSTLTKTAGPTFVVENVADCCLTTDRNLQSC